MVKINKLSNAIRIADATDLCDNFGVEIQNSGIDDTHLINLGIQFGSTHKLMVQALDRVHANSFLNEKDNEREDCFRAVNNLNKGYLYYPDPEIRDAAEEVEKVLEDFRSKLKNANYSAESAILDSLFERLGKSGMAVFIDVLPGLRILINKLIESQNQFKEAEALWAKSQTDNKKTESATVLKGKFVKVVNDELVIYLMALSQSKPNTYQELAAKIDLFIDHANTLVKRRRNGEEDEEDIKPEDN